MSLLQETAQFGSVVGELIAGLQCPVSFPVPAPGDDPFAVLQLEQCLPAVQLNPVGGLVPEFLGLTADELAAITDLDDLPTFDELYVAPPSGPFDTSTVQVWLSLHFLLNGYLWRPGCTANSVKRLFYLNRC